MDKRRSFTTISAIGVGQIFAWGSSYYLIAVLANPVAKDTGWPMTWIVTGLSLALFVAGLASPRAGAAIERLGGRIVLAASSLLLAAGLLLLALTHHIALWYAAWLLIGLGMSCGLYDAAFATLGQIYGAKARRAIANVTLFGGLASTICWPLSALLIGAVGWRGACLAYAALQCFVMLPLHLLVVPRFSRSIAAPGVREIAGERRSSGAMLLLLGAILTLAAAVGAIMSVHLITILQARGLALAAAVGLGAIFGPAQVAARVFELALGRHYHPVWTLFASVLLMCVGVSLLGLDGSAAWIGASLVVYGAGSGVHSIARGTAPLALFGPEGYARRMGKLASPALVAQALAPPLAAWLIERDGVEPVLQSLLGLTVASAVLAVVLIVATRNMRAD